MTDVCDHTWTAGMDGGVYCAGCMQCLGTDRMLAAYVSLPDIEAERDFYRDDSIRLASERDEARSAIASLHEAHTRNIAQLCADKYAANAKLAAYERVVEAAKAWHDVNTGQHTNGPQHTLAMRDTRVALIAALDALDGKDASK